MISSSQRMGVLFTCWMTSHRSGKWPVANPRPAVHLFKPSDAVRRVYTANIDFYLESVTDPIRLEVLDGKGALVRELRVRGAGSRNQPSARQGRGRQRGGGSGVKAGLNRLRWDLRCPGATVFEGMILESSNPSNGPWAPPGQYAVKLTVGDQSWIQPLNRSQRPAPWSGYAARSGGAVHFGNETSRPSQRR